MYRALVCLMSFLSVLSTPIASAESRIELLDGSTVTGDVVAFSNGRYIVDSPSLGRLEIDESAIRSIEPGGTRSAQGAYGAQIQSIQQQILANPKWVEMIVNLQSDPQLQAALRDPKFVQLILSGDLDALQSDPQILELLNNPSIQAIVSAVQGR